MPTTLKPNTIHRNKDGYYFRVFAQIGECVFASDSWKYIESAKKSTDVYAHFPPHYDSWQEVDAEGNAVVGRWEPSMQEDYYIPDTDEGVADYAWDRWRDFPEDKARLANNLVCKTKEQAIAKAQKMLDAVKE